MASWKSSRLVKENIAEEIARLKRQPGIDLAIFGSAGLASTFMRLGLIEEYRILVAPVVLGGERPMFKDLKSRVNLKFVNIETFRSGVVVLFDQPIRKETKR